MPDRYWPQTSAKGVTIERRDVLTFIMEIALETVGFALVIVAVIVAVAYGCFLNMHEKSQKTSIWLVRATIQRIYIHQAQDFQTFEDMQIIQARTLDDAKEIYKRYVENYMGQTKEMSYHYMIQTTHQMSEILDWDSTFYA